jgi:hypothetical protein
LRLRMSGRLVAEGGREDDLGVFAGFERQFVNVVSKKVEEIFLYNESEELVYCFWVDLDFCCNVSILSGNVE